MVPKKSYQYYNITWMERYIKNNNICVSRELITFVGIALLSTQTNCILLMQLQEIRSSFGLDFTFMSVCVFPSISPWSVSEL